LPSWRPTKSSRLGSGDLENGILTDDDEQPETQK
jgi:hypothetical protein